MLLRLEQLMPNRHPRLRRFSSDWSVGWSDVSLVGLLHPFLSRIFVRLQVYWQQVKRNPPQIFLFVHNLEFLREYQIMSDKGETENKGESRGSSRAWGRSLGSTAAVQIGYSQCGLLGCSPLKVLQSLNLSHIQSLRWCIYRKTWKLEKHKDFIRR